MAVEATKLNIPGAAPYGFRLYGGEGEKLVVAKLRVQSKAYEVGLREGDVILGINGRSCENITHGHASSLLEKSSTNLELHIISGGSGNDVIRAAYHQLSSQLRPPSPFAVQNGPGSCDPGVTQDSGNVSITFESKSTVAPKLTTSELISTVTNGGATSDQQPQFHITKIEQPNGAQHSHAEEVIVYRHVPILNHYQSEVPEPLSELRHRRPLQTNAIVKPFVPQPVKENLPPIVPYVPQAPRHEFPPPVQQYPDSHNQRTGSSADFKVSQTSVTPWVWQPSHVERVVSKPLAEFQLESVPEDADHYEIVARFTPGEGRENNEERDANSGEGDDIPLHLIKILTCSSDADFIAFKKKKIFADSMFYDDPEHKYPTIQEQIKMARMVAQSLTAPVNITARGQRMFMKRKEKSSVWSIDNPGYHRHSTGEDLYYNPTPWNSEAKKSPTQWHSESKKSPTPWQSESKKFPTQWHSESKKSPTPWHSESKKSPTPWHSESKKSSSVVQWEKKVQIPPAFTKSKNKSIGKVGGAKARVSFGVSDELLRMKGKGGELFARRRAKSEEIEDHATSPQLKQFGGSHMNGERPSSVRSWSGNMDEEVERDLRPQARLKEMIETNRSVCQSPWDSGVGYLLDLSVGNLKPWENNVQAPSRESHSDRGSATFIHKSSRGYGPVSFKTPQVYGSMPALNRDDSGAYTDF